MYASKPRDCKKRYPSCLNNFRCYVKEYSDRSTIHGLSFLLEGRRSIAERQIKKFCDYEDMCCGLCHYLTNDFRDWNVSLLRLWWLIFLVLSLYLCVSLIISAYNKWQRSPVIVTFATAETPLREIPFPAVTICPTVKMNVKKFNLTRLMQLRKAGNTTFEEENQLNYISLICPNVKNIEVKNGGPNLYNDDASEFFVKVRPDFGSMVHSCYWANTDCSTKINNYFVPVITNEGICFTFNMLHTAALFTQQIQKTFSNISAPQQKAVNWNLDTGYLDNDGLSDTPRRAGSAGVLGGFDLILKTPSHDLNNMCSDFFQGYKVIIHYPAQMPNTNKFYFYLGLNQMVLASVKPNLIKTAKELKNYSPTVRKCYFLKERRLRFFKIYDQQGCYTECLTNFIKEHCGCVEFFHPRDETTPVCGSSSYSCLRQAKAIYFKNVVDEETNFGLNHCDCLPVCNSLDYQTDLSYCNGIASPKMYGFPPGLNQSSNQMSRIQVYFKEKQFMSLERSELYGPTDFLANCGGILSLFFGFSFLSVVEIVYFATLRLICNIHRHGCYYWSGSKELGKIEIM